MSKLRYPVFLALGASLFLACDEPPPGDDDDSSQGDSPTPGSSPTPAPTPTPPAATPTPTTTPEATPTPWPLETLVFPEGFVFGAAVAGFQVDMGCPTLDRTACEDPYSDWFVFTTTQSLIDDPANYLSGQHPSDVSPGFFELYEEDLDRLQDELKGSSFRFSIEWSRIFPTATDGIEGFDALKAVASADGLKYYHDLLAAVKARGITPLVTLNHYTLPTWIHDAVGCHEDLATCSPKGWLDPERTVREIAKYAGFVAQEFAGEIDLWATLNEPFSVLLPGYLYPSAERSNPPSVMLAQSEALVVLGGMVEAHARMYDAVKAADTVDADGDGQASRVGVVYNMTPAAPKDPTNPLDVQAAENVFYLWNLVYLNAVVLGQFDDDLDGEAEYHEDLDGRMDYIGINYYTRITVEGTRIATFPELSPLSTFNPATLQTWEDYPRGLYDMVLLVHNDYHLPTFITENGAQDPNDDGTSGSYMVRHLTWLARAIDEGAEVGGYFYWSLMDNYEWNHGMDVRMGLYAVEAEDPDRTRTARQSVGTFAAIAESASISIELQETWPAQ